MTTEDYDWRRNHGIMMAVAFAWLLPLGALFARAVKMHHLETNVPNVGRVMFHCHVICQVTAAILSTISLIYVVRRGPDFRDVPYSHGKIGVVAMTLLYIQAVGGLLRAPPQPYDQPRKTWEVLHNLLGRWSIVLTLSNVAIGIAVLTTLESIDPTRWIGLVIASIAIIVGIQAVMDRREKQYHVSYSTRQVPYKEVSHVTEPGFHSVPHITIPTIVIRK